MVIDLEDIIELKDSGYVCRCYDYRKLYEIIFENCMNTSSDFNCNDLINILEQVKTAIILKHIDKCNNDYRCCN
jgi:hypothetical protein